MRRKQIVGIGLIVIMLVCSGCQKSPEGSIVKNKDFDKMVEQAQKEESAVSDVADMAEYDTYQDTFSDETLGVTVKVDAKVDIPQTDQMSIIRIRQKEISQEFLNQVKEALVPEVTLCDGSMLRTPTKSDIEEEIRRYKKNIEEAEACFAAGETNEEGRDILLEEYQSAINDLQEQYETAPAEINLTDYPSDGQFHAVADLLSKNPGSDYYQWQQNLNENGSIYYGAGESSDGLHHVIYAQNNENYGNCLRYENNIDGYWFLSAVSVTSPLGNGYSAGDLWKASEEPRISVEDAWNEIQEVEGQPALLSLEEAQDKADNLMASLNLNEYSCYDGDLYCQYQAIEDGVLKYRKVYVFQYFRNIDGVYVNNEGMSKLMDDWQGDEYVKKEWPGESVLVYVNDSGIAGFYYLAPMEPVETVVEKSSMKSFDEIKDIFKQMIVLINASEAEKRTINIDRIVLRYTRISEADSFDTGLLVPVWDFEGIIEDEFRKDPIKGSLLTINAIDGTVIDKQLGY